jgi:hypothetical protein
MSEESHNCIICGAETSDPFGENIPIDWIRYLIDERGAKPIMSQFVCLAYICDDDEHQIQWHGLRHGGYSWASVDEAKELLDDMIIEHIEYKDPLAHIDDE